MGTYQKLRAKMTPQARAKAKARANQMRAVLALRDLRRAAGLTQAALARSMGISQATLSQIENQRDSQVSTLRKVVEACGGKLELVAHMGGREMSIAMSGRTARASRTKKAV